MKWKIRRKKNRIALTSNIITKGNRIPRREKNTLTHRLKNIIFTSKANICVLYPLDFCNSISSILPNKEKRKSGGERARMKKLSWTFKCPSKIDCVRITRGIYRIFFLQITRKKQIIIRPSSSSSSLHIHVLWGFSHAHRGFDCCWSPYNVYIRTASFTNFCVPTSAVRNV